MGGVTNNPAPDLGDLYMSVNILEASQPKDSDGLTQRFKDASKYLAAANEGMSFVGKKSDEYGEFVTLAAQLDGIRKETITALKALGIDPTKVDTGARPPSPSTTNSSGG